MKLHKSFSLSFLLGFGCVGMTVTANVAAAEGPVAWWAFDSAAEDAVADRAAKSGCKWPSTAANTAAS